MNLLPLLKPRSSSVEKTIDKVLPEYLSMEDDYQGLGLGRIAWFLGNGPYFFQKIQKSWS